MQALLVSTTGALGSLNNSSIWVIIFSLWRQMPLHLFSDNGTPFNMRALRLHDDFRVDHMKSSLYSP